ncbi:Gfo/Idh/MocA family oxidoreductase [Pelagibacterales bacterium SAG-MED46]|nr:Gfo/Idh/MocA family oxidoreductase [Pelagibacterales bacterium SAG-MED46]
MKKLNWGVIGLGNIAQKFLDGFSGVQNSNLLAIASKSPTKLVNFKKQFNIKEEFVYNEYEDLINSKDIDIIYISLPNSLHYYWIERCLKNKKNVLVEKPATLNFTEAKNLEKIFLKENLFFAEAFMYRYDPQIENIIKIIKENEIGNLLSMESSFGVNIMTKKKFFFLKKNRKIDKNSRLFNPKLGGGCVLDLGCYPTSLSLLISSLIKNIDYQDFKMKNLKKEIGQTDVSIDAEMEIIFDNLFSSKVKASFKKDLGNNTIIKGDKGDIIVNNTFLGIKDIQIALKDKSYEIKNLPLQNMFSNQIENISKSILNGSNQAIFPGMQFQETLLNMKILDNWNNA